MVGVLIVTHADLGQELINAVALIAGEQEKVKAIGLHHGDGVDSFEKAIMDSIEALDEGDGVLVFTDFLGGTPANAVMRCMKKKSFPCITGANMPMVVEALTDRDGLDARQVEASCLQVGMEGIIKLEDVYEQSRTQEYQDDTSF